MSKTKFHKCNIKDIKVVIQDIPFEKIRSSGYDEGINNRPIRLAHVSKMVASPEHESFDNKLLVMYNDTKDLYFIFDGQHHYDSLVEFIDKGIRKQPKTLKCGVAHRISTGRIMSSSNKQDSIIALKQGYGRNSGSEKPAVGDAINVIYQEGQYILESLGYDTVDPTQTQKTEMYKILHESEFGYVKINLETMKKYYNYGISLTKAELLKEAQVCRWTRDEIAHFHKTGEKPDDKECMSDDNEEPGIIGGIKFLPEQAEVANSINESIDDSEGFNRYIRDVAVKEHKGVKIATEFMAKCDREDMMKCDREDMMKCDHEIT